MSTWVRGFVIPDVADTHAAFQRCIRDAELLTALEARYHVDRGGRRALADLQASYRTFQNGLRAAADRAAVKARQGMRDRLQGHRLRPETGSIPPLRELVDAQPLRVGGYETGAVGVGDVDKLNRAINPHTPGFGPFWRAIEYGTGQDGVPSQLGRILYGAFTEPGGDNPTPPDPQFAGGGGGPHPVFIPKSQGVSNYGLGTIGAEIQPKHFIKSGADEAAVEWRETIAKVQARAIEEITALKFTAL